MLLDLQAAGNQIKKVNIVEGFNKEGIAGIRGATVDYVNLLGQAEKRWLLVDSSIQRASSRTINLKENTSSWLSNLGRAFAQTMQYALSYRLLNEAVNQLGRGGMRNRIGYDTYDTYGSTSHRDDKEEKILTMLMSGGYNDGEYHFDENEDYPYEVKEQDVEEYVDSLTNEKYRKFAKESGIS